MTVRSRRMDELTFNVEYFTTEDKIDDKKLADESQQLSIDGDLLPARFRCRIHTRS